MEFKAKEKTVQPELPLADREETKAQTPQNSVPAEDHYKKIFRAIEWPRFPKALKRSGYAILATAIISTVVYSYEFGVHALISLLT